MPKIKPANDKKPANLEFYDKEDYFLIKIMKDAPIKKSSTGRSDILASSEGWLSLIDLSGKHLSNKEVGINISVTTRDKKSTKTKKPRADDD